MTTARRTRRVAGEAAEASGLAATRLVAARARADQAPDRSFEAVLDLADELAALAADLWGASMLDEFNAGEEDDAEDS